MKSENTPSPLPHRSRIEIMACILDNCKDGLSETILIDRCNLSFSQFNLYKKALAETGLLTAYGQKKENDVFETTERGREFLKDFREIKSILSKS